MYCQHCNGFYEDGAVNCTVCGRPVTGDDPTAGISVTREDTSGNWLRAVSWLLWPWVLLYLGSFGLTKDPSAVAAISAVIALLIFGVAATIIINRARAREYFPAHEMAQVQRQSRKGFIASIILTVLLLALLNNSAGLAWGNLLPVALVLVLCYGISRRSAVCAVILLLLGLAVITWSLFASDVSPVLGGVCLLFAWEGLRQIHRYRCNAHLLAQTHAPHVETVEA